MDLQEVSGGAVLEARRALPQGYVPCAYPEKVEYYVRIQVIMELESEDFYTPCPYCEEDTGEEIFWCYHRMNDKREDGSYKALLEHLEEGGGFNDPVQFPSGNCGGLGNGHHRVIAALDAGFTHVPAWLDWGSDYDWSGVSERATEALESWELGE
jgi:hypothetical protein